MNPFLDAAIRKTRSRYLVIGTFLSAMYAIFLWNWGFYRTIQFLVILGVIAFTSFYRAFDRPRRLRRLLYEEPEKIVRGYIEYRFLPLIRRVHMTFLHLIDDQGRNHVLPAKDETVINLIEEIKRLAPKVDWHGKADGA